MFRIPLDSDENGSDKATHIFCDNTSIVNNCTNVEPVLNKNHSSCAYRFNRWTVASNTVSIAWIKTNENLADVFTKRLPENKRKYLFGNFTY